MCQSAFALPVIYLEDGTKANGGFLVAGKTYIIKDSESTNVYFTVSDERIAKIDSVTGVLKALNAGSVTINSVNKSTGEISSKSVSVRKRAESLTLNYSKIYFYSDTSGNSFYNGFVPAFKAKIYPEDSTDIVRYKSENSDIVNVLSESGKAEPKANGSSVITAYALESKTSSVDDPENATATANVYSHVHKYSLPYKYKMSDSFYHYAECKNDGCTAMDDTKRNAYSEHKFLNVNGVNICTACQYSIKAIPGHSHTWKTEYAYDGERHYLVCENDECNATKSPEMHNFGADNKCKVCKAEHEHNSWDSAMSLDMYGHWYSCTKCDARKDYAQHHSSDTSADCKTDVMCDDCGAVYTKGSHILGDEWLFNGYGHYKICTVCYKSTQNQTHTYVKDTENTIKCSECNNVVHTHDWSEWEQAGSSGHKRTCTKQQMDQNGKVQWFETEAAEHTYDENNKCTVCSYTAESVPELKDGFYQICSVDDLRWFSSKVNGGNNGINATVVNDLDMSDAGNLIIGKSESLPFAGVFDGNGKKITNIYFEVTQNCFGLFGSVSGGTVKNLTVEGKVLLRSGGNTYERIGGVVGKANGGAIISNVLSNVEMICVPELHHIGGIVGSAGEIGSGSLTIEKCAYFGTLYAEGTKDCVGGILGYARDCVYITDCAFTGSITAKEGGYTGGILGYINNNSFGKLENCFANGKSSGAMIIGTIRKCSSNVSNNVIKSGEKAYVDERGSRFTAYEATEDDFKSGKVTWILNRGEYNGTQVWYQKIGTTSPSFFGETVYLTEDNKYTNTMPNTMIQASNGSFKVMYLKNPCILILSSYKSLNLVDVVLKNISSDVTVSVAESGLTYDNADTVKAMVIKDMLTIMPECKSIQINVSENK